LERAFDRIPKMILKYQPKMEEKFRKTFEKMEGFSSVTPVTGLSRPILILERKMIKQRKSVRL
jgi:hypothetical protein